MPSTFAVAVAVYLGLSVERWLPPGIFIQFMPFIVIECPAISEPLNLTLVPPHSISPDLDPPLSVQETHHNSRRKTRAANAAEIHCLADLI